MKLVFTLPESKLESAKKDVALWIRDYKVLDNLDATLEIDTYDIAPLIRFTGTREEFFNHGAAGCIAGIFGTMHNANNHFCDSLYEDEELDLPKNYLEAFIGPDLAKGKLLWYHAAHEVIYYMSKEEIQMAIWIMPKEAFFIDHKNNHAISVTPIYNKLLFEAWCDSHNEIEVNAFKASIRAMLSARVSLSTILQTIHGYTDQKESYRA